MIKFTKDDYVDVDLFDERLNQTGYILFDREKMMQYLPYEESRAQSLVTLIVDTMAWKSALGYYALDRKLIYGYLRYVERCPEHYFSTKKSQSFSLDKKKVLSKLFANGYANEFLTYYMKYSSIKSSCSSITSYIQKYKEPECVNRFGVLLYKMYYTAEVQQNLRFSYNNESIISIPKEYNSFIGVRPGRFLAWGDFKQADFRICCSLFIRTEADKAIMDSVEDKYMAIAIIIYKFEGKEFDAEEFKKERVLYKTLVLETIYGTKKSVVAVEDAFIRRLLRYLNNCPRYVEFVRRLQVRSSLGLPIKVVSYFGYEQIVGVEGKSTNDVINKCLNTPVQTGTSEVIILVANKILDTFYEMGYTKEDICIYYARYDEVIFDISEKVLADIWVLNNCNTIIIDDWMPMELSFKFGYNYTVEDEELTATINKNFDENIDKIDIVEESPSSDEPYYPVKNVLSLELQAIEIPELNKVVITFYNKYKSEAMYYLLDKTSDSAINDYVVTKIRELEPGIYEEDYRDVVVVSGFKIGERGEDYINNRTYVKYVQASNAVLRAVGMLCEYMVCKYCKKAGVESPVSAPHESCREFLDSVSIMKFKESSAKQEA